MLVSRPKGRERKPAPPIVYKAPPVGGAFIAELVPRYDYRDAFQVVVAASAETSYEGAMRLGMRLPLGRRFTVVAERPGREIVFAAIGKPWRVDDPSIAIPDLSFAAFDQPGFAKIAWSWIVKPLGSGQSLLIFELRTRCTDDQSRAAFTRYWLGAADGMRVVAPGGARHDQGGMRAATVGDLIEPPRGKARAS